MPFFQRRTLALLILGLVTSPAASAYPLDGAEASGIQRLIGYRTAQQAERGPKLPRGALLGTGDIRLTLADRPDAPMFDAVPADPVLQAAVESIFLERDPSYGFVVVDLTDPHRIGWAGVRPDTRQMPGSVGKLLTMVGLFDALARAFPDIEDRQRVLRETRVTGGDWVLYDEHAVPKFDPATATNRFGIIQPDDTFVLAEWIDHMISASANAAGAVVWREAMLLRHFGDRYPVGAEEARAYFTATPPRELTALSLAVVHDPLRGQDIRMTTRFLEDLPRRAAQLGRSLVLPEGEDPRVLEAAARLVRERIARPVLLGEPEHVRRALEELDADPEQWSVLMEYHDGGRSG